MIGKCSEFGGPDDEGMVSDTGLALYEPWEADRRPDIFMPDDPEWVKAHPGERQPTWARLRTDFYYIAMRYDPRVPRKILQNIPHKVRNPVTNEWAIAFLVDFGPHESTGRLVDCSPRLLQRLGVETDAELDVVQLDTQICRNQ